MKSTNYLAGAFLVLICATASAQKSSSSQLFQADLGNTDNQELVVLTVTYPPGVSSSAHRHNAHTYVYVLEGSVQMQVAGGELMTLGPGDDFYETPADIHSVSRNASNTQPAKILVVFVKEQGAPMTVAE